MERLRADAAGALQNISQAQAQINKCFGALRSNLDHVATQVRTNMARQSDSLRMREAWLLKQLELVYADKTEVLTRQRDRLTEASDTLKSCLQNPACSENQLVDCIDSLTSVNLLPEETPFISFRVDSALLREVISQYGRVVPGYSGHFADPARPSACLPRPFEEEDEEGSGVQMSHKPLQSTGAVRIPHTGHGRAFVRAWLSQQHHQQQQQQLTKMGAANSCASKTDCTDSFEILSPFGASPNFPTAYPGHESRDDWLVRERAMDTSAGSTWQSVFSDIISQPTHRWLQHVAAPNNSQRSESWDVAMGSTYEDNGDEEIVDAEKDVDHAAIVAGVCAAPLTGGDPCKTFDDCCCDDSCLNRLLERPAPNGGKVDRMLSEWLMSKEGRPNVGQDSSNSCLKEEAVEMRDEEDEEERRFRDRQSKEFWLKRFQTTTQCDSPCITTSSFKFQHIDDDMGKWLFRASEVENTVAVSKSSTSRSSSHDPSNEQWLLSCFRKKMDLTDEDQPNEVKWLQ